MGVLDGFEVVTRGNLEQVALVQVTQFKPQRHGQVSNGVRHLFHSVHGGVCGGGSPPFGRSQVHQRREFRKEAHDCQVWLWHFEQVTLTEIVGRPWMLGGGIAFRKTDGLADGLGEGQVGGGSDAQGHGSNASSYGGKGGENLCGKSVGDLVGDLVGRGHGCTGAHGGGWIVGGVTASAAAACCFFLSCFVLGLLGFGSSRSFTIETPIKHETQHCCHHLVTLAGVERRRITLN